MIDNKATSVAAAPFNAASLRVAQNGSNVLVRAAFPDMATYMEAVGILKQEQSWTVSGQLEFDGPSLNLYASVPDSNILQVADHLHKIGITNLCTAQVPAPVSAPR